MQELDLSVIHKDHHALPLGRMRATHLDTFSREHFVFVIHLVVEVEFLSPIANVTVIGNDTSVHFYSKLIQITTLVLASNGLVITVAPIDAIPANG